MNPQLEARRIHTRRDSTRRAPVWSLVRATKPKTREARLTPAGPNASRPGHGTFLTLSESRREGMAAADSPSRTPQAEKKKTSFDKNKNKNNNNNNNDSSNKTTSPRLALHRAPGEAGYPGPVGPNSLQPSFSKATRRAKNPSTSCEVPRRLW